MTPIAPPVPVVAASPALAEPASTFNASDLARLRELIQAAAAQTANPAGVPIVTDPSAIDAAAKATGRSFGDSILESVLRFSTNYESSMRSIETRLQDVVRSESSGLTNFSEILALQIDVSKWSMSIMGVDNASKAGSNTIKELSRGG